MKPFKGITVCEYEFREIKEFDSKEEMIAYSEGFTDGANEYGCGSAGFYSLNDLEELEKGSIAEKIIAKLIKENLQ